MGSGGAVSSAGSKVKKSRDEWELHRQKDIESIQTAWKELEGARRSKAKHLPSIESGSVFPSFCWLSEFESRKGIFKLMYYWISAN